MSDAAKRIYVTGERTYGEPKGQAVVCEVEVVKEQPSRWVVNPSPATGFRSTVPKDGRGVFTDRADAERYAETRRAERVEAARKQLAELEAAAVAFIEPGAWF
jgi:hypothetical protein